MGGSLLQHIVAIALSLGAAGWLLRRALVRKKGGCAACALARRSGGVPRPAGAKQGSTAASLRSPRA